MANIVAKLLSIIDSTTQNIVAKLLSIERQHVIFFSLLSASLPPYVQIIDFAFGDSFTFHTPACFPLVVVLNILFLDLPEIEIVEYIAMPIISFSILSSIFFINKLFVMSIVNSSDNFYFWLMVVANSHVIVALFLTDFKRPVERRYDDDATCFKYQVICILLISPFLKSEGAEQSANSVLFKLCGMGTIVLLYVLPCMRRGWEFKVRVLNLSSAYFLVFLLLVFELKEIPVYSLMSCLFILLCSFVVFYDGIAEMKRDVTIEDFETHPDEIVEEVSQPNVIPLKITQLPDPVWVSSEPTSPQIISLAHTRKSSCESYSRDEEEQEAVHEAEFEPTNVARFMPNCITYCSLFPADYEEEQEAVHEAEFEPTNVAKFMPNCITYCSLFPADYEFTRDIVVWSWMAAGIIKPDNNDEMEEVAIKCFDTLVARKSIMMSGYDGLSDQMMYKLGDSDNVFNYEEQYSRLKHRQILDDYTNLGELEHLSLISKEINEEHFEIVKKCKNLKTLLLHKCNMSELERSLNGIFSSLKLLTTLDLSFTNITELPGSVENLSSLKCLDLSRTPIRWLPVSIESLNNLETLILLGCKSLHDLPREMSKLTNLQNFSLDIRLQLNAMPVGMGRLTKLQSLRAFPVGRKDGNRIGELRDMNKLKGSLCICKLENILSVEESEMALLCNKQLTELEFLWSDLDHQDAMVPVEEEILENLRPHFGLQKLKIGFFSGGILPSWISNPCFDQMINITVSCCRYCERLPTFGELPSLKFLSVFEMDSIIDIDIFFCRKLSKEDIPAFPKLEKLSIEGMSNLVKWTGVKDCDFASLVHLAIKYCPKLVSLQCMSHLNSLRHLEISYCDELVCLPEIRGSVLSLLVRECPKLDT